MQKIKKDIYSPYLLASIIFILSACGGSSGGGETTTNTSDIPTTTGGTPNPIPIPIPIDTVGTTDVVIVPLSSLGPLKDRLYPGAPNTTIITGPILGSGLLDNSELIYEVPFEVVGESEDELVVEMTYLVRDYVQRTMGVLQFDVPIPELFVIVTNVSNKMMCNVDINSVSLELKNGEIIDVNINEDGARGFVAVQDESENDLRDFYANDCIPAGHSATVYGSLESLISNSTDIENLVGDVEDIEKVVIGELAGRQDETFILITDGMHATSFEQNADGDGFLATLVNVTSLNLRNERVRAFFIDAATSLPLMAVSLGRPPGLVSQDLVVIAPGEEFGGVFSDDFFIGSTNSIIVYPEYSDNNSQ